MNYTRTSILIPDGIPDGGAEMCRKAFLRIPLAENISAEDAHPELFGTEVEVVAVAIHEGENFVAHRIELKSDKEHIQKLIDEGGACYKVTAADGTFECDPRELEYQPIPAESRRIIKGIYCGTDADRLMITTPEEV